MTAQQAARGTQLVQPIKQAEARAAHARSNDVHAIAENI
jgi:hypothetical protein